MKTRIISVVMTAIVLLSFLFQLSSCKKDTPLSTQDQVKLKLFGRDWIIQNVTVDDVDNTNLFTGMTIRFSPGVYTSTHGGGVWPASGSWNFTSADATAFVRDDGLIVQVKATDTSLELQLDWNKNTFDGGRVNSISGHHVFTFSKK